VGVADAGPGLGGVLVLNTLDPPAATLRYSGPFFDVDMDQLAGVSGLDASDHPAAVAVQIAQATHAMTLEHPVQRGGRDACPRGQTWRRRSSTTFRSTLAGVFVGHRRGRLERSRDQRSCLLIATPPLVSGLA